MPALRSKQAGKNQARVVKRRGINTNKLEKKMSFDLAPMSASLWCKRLEVVTRLMEFYLILSILFYFFPFSNGTVGPCS